MNIIPQIPHNKRTMQTPIVTMQIEFLNLKTKIMLQLTFLKAVWKLKTKTNYCFQ